MHGGMNHLTTARRMLLKMTIGWMAITALLGVGMMLLGQFGETELRILATTFSVTWLSLTTLASATVASRPILRPVAAAGVATGVLAALTAQALIWGDNPSEWLFKTWACTSLVNAACAYSGLVGMARAARGYGWVRGVSIGAATLIAGILCTMILVEDASELAIRILGALAVVMACGTVVVGVLHRLAPKTVDGPLPASLKATCPVCGTEGELAIGGKTSCSECGLGLEIQIVPVSFR